MISSSSEQAILRAAARAKPSQMELDHLRRLATDCDYPRLIALACEHGVLGLVAANLAASGAANPDRADQLHDIVQDITAVNLRYAGQLLDLIDALRERGIRAISFKGPALAASGYRHLGIRTFGDLDILVHPAAMRRACQVMIERGFGAWYLNRRVFEVYPRAGKEEVFIPPAPGIAPVDMHATPYVWALAVRQSTSDLMNRARTIDLAGTPIETLSAEDSLLVLAAHGLVHQWDALRFAADIRASLDSVDWELVIARARVARLLRILSVALLVARDELGADLPPVVVRTVEGDSVARQLAGEVRASLFAAWDEGGRIRVRRHLRRACREHSSDKLRYLLRAPLYRFFCASGGFVIKQADARRRASSTIARLLRIA